MKLVNIIRDSLKKTGLSFTDVAEALASNYGKPMSRQSVQDRLSLTKHENAAIGSFNRILRIAGYRLVVIPAGVGVPKNGVEVTDGLEEEEA